MVRGECNGVSPPREVPPRPRVLAHILKLTFKVLRELNLLRYSLMPSLHCVRTGWGEMERERKGREGGGEGERERDEIQTLSGGRVLIAWSTKYPPIDSCFKFSIDVSRFSQIMA